MVLQQGLIGKVRVEFADAMESSGNYVRSKKFEFLWVDEFPLFESEDNGDLVSAHHPFTRPHHDDMENLSTDPTKVNNYFYFYKIIRTGDNNINKIDFR